MCSALPYGNTHPGISTVILAHLDFNALHGKLRGNAGLSTRGVEAVLVAVNILDKSNMQSFISM
jgi:hypothetical protein